MQEKKYLTMVKISRIGGALIDQGKMSIIIDIFENAFPLRLIDDIHASRIVMPN